MVIRRTNNYEMFNTLAFNRDISERHVKNLAESINRHNWLELFPIIVDGDYNVLDGQHRLKAAEMLDEPIYYVTFNTQDQEAAIDFIQLINSNNVNWSYEDYANCYITLGRQDYEVAKKMKDRFGVSWTSLLVLLGGSDNTESRKRFKRGDLTISVADIEMVKRYEMWFDLFKESAGDYVRRSPFLRAIKHLDREGVDFERMREKLESSGWTFEHAENTSGYLRQMEGIYNYMVKTTARERIF